jgi:hypothetical protein
MIKQDDLMNKKEEKSTENKKENIKVNIPIGYIPIELSSLGKLSAPATLHFRNFEYSEMIELSSITDENYFIDRLIDCLNRMVYEKNFDCGDLTEKELNEILMNIHYNFHGKEINLPYYDIDVDKKRSYDTKLKSGLVDLTKLQDTIDINENFKEPITFVLGEDKKFSFRLPRIKDAIKVRNEIKTKYREKEKEFTSIRKSLEYNERMLMDNKPDNIIPIDPVMETKYISLQEKKITDLLVSLQKESLIGWNGKNNLVGYEKEQAFTDKDIGYIIEKFDQVIKSINYGLRDEYTFIFGDPETGETESKTRRLEFRPILFIPEKESKKIKDIEVQFG